MIYKFIKKYRSAFRVVKMCQVLEVSRSSYYNWLKRPLSTHQKEDKILVEKMRRIHKESYKTYGIRRIKAKLNKEGISCGKNRIARLMRENGVFSRQGFLYLSGIEDLFQRKVVGWSLGDRITKELTISSLEQAVGRENLRLWFNPAGNPRL